MSEPIIEYTAPISVAGRISDALRNGRAFSLVRIGDGEASILQYPNYCCNRRIQAVLSRAIDGSNFTSQEISNFRSLLLSAIAASDVVGLYSSSHPNILSRIYSEYLKDVVFSENALYCSPGIHFYLQQAGHLRSFIELADSVTLITGRNVIDEFKRVFPSVRVEQFLIPSEKDYRLSMEEGMGNHYPEAFETLRQSVTGGARNLVLVGGGFLGKSYCEWARLRGAVALDIGSVFDYWAGIPTREGYLTVKDGSLKLDKPSLRPGMNIASPSLAEDKAALTAVSVLGDHSIRQSPMNFVAKFRVDQLQARLKRLNLEAASMMDVEKSAAIAALLIWLEDFDISRFVYFGDLGRFGSKATTDVAFYGIEVLNFEGEDFKNEGVSALVVAIGISEMESYDLHRLINAIRSGMKSVFFFDFRVYEFLKNSFSLKCEEDFDLKLTTASMFSGSSGFISLR